MAGFQNPKAADYAQRMDGYGLRLDDGVVDLSGKGLLSVEVTVTLAELNAGKVLVPAVPGRVYRPTDFFLGFNGTFAAATDIRLSDTAGSPVDIVTIGIAQAGTGVVHTRSKGTNTLGPGLLFDLTASKGIQIRKTGSTATGGTSILVQVQYRITA